MTNFVNATTPVQIYVPAGSFSGPAGGGTAGQPHAWVFNQGGATAYVGGPNVTPFAGIPVPPGTEIKIPVAFPGLFAVSGILSLGGSTTTTAAANAGATSLALTAGIGTVGTFYVVSGTGNSAVGSEVVQAAAGGGTTAVTITPALLYDHRSGSNVFVANLAPTTLHVEALTG